MVTQVNDIELIKDRLDIVDALSIYAGVNFNKKNLNREKIAIRCPFHPDSSPSMTVYPRSNRFRCWKGCNDSRSGDVIDVVMLGHNLSMAEAIKRLRDDLQINGSQVDSETSARITEKRRELEQIKIDKDTLKWSIEALQWLSKEIPNQSKTIKTDEDLNAFAPFLYIHAQVEYKLDCLLGLEDCFEWQKVEVIEWTKIIAEGVGQLVRAGRNGRGIAYKVG